MRRGDLVIIAAPGDYGKPRPAVVIQSDDLNKTAIESVVVCLMTSAKTGATATRVPIKPTPKNGLQKPSSIMVDKLFTLPKEKVTRVIGELTSHEISELNQILTFVLDI